MSERMNINLTGTTFTDYLLTDVGASAFQLEHDWFTRQDLVIRTAAAGGGTLLVEGTDYTLDTESLDLSERVSVAVGSGRNVFHEIAIINGTYQSGDLYFSGKYIADSVEAADFNMLEALLLPSRAIRGLTLSNNSGDANNDVDIGVGAAVDDTGVDGLVLAASLTKRSDAAWAVGTGNGGMDTGTKPANGWLYVWLIKRPDTGVVDALFSISATSPSMPTNYTLKRRIGSLQTSSSNIVAFAQYGDRFIWKAVASDRAIAAIPNTDRNLQTLTAPPNTIAILEVIHSAAGGNPHCWIRPTTYTDAAASTTNRTLTATISNTAALEMQVEVDASSQIAYRGDSTNLQMGFLTAGFVDARGKE